MHDHPTILPCIADLLSETDWIRRLAASLCGDGAADDVTQETLVRAIRNRPRQDVPVRAWLARVVRNLAVSRDRANARRGARERAAAKAERCPSVIESLEHAELLALLAEEVQRLDDGLRAPIVLRFLDGLPLREVARALDLPSETVRKRLTRAREKLRARLQTRLGDSWGTACLALTTRHEVTTAASVGSALHVLQSATLMSSLQKTVVAVAIVLVLAVSWWAWLGPPPPTPLTPRELAPASENASATIDTPESRRGAVRVAVATPDESERFLDLPLARDRFGWTGRVVRAEDGSPVPGARVLVEEGNFEVIIDTDEHGRFTWLQRHDRKRSLTFIGLAAGRVGRAKSATADRPAAEVVLPVFDARSVRVRVLDERTRGAVRGAPVSLTANGHRCVARTDASGLAELAVAVEDSRQLVGDFSILPGPTWGVSFQRRFRPGSGDVIEYLVRTYPRRATLRAVHAESKDPLLDARFLRVIEPAAGENRWLPTTRLEPGQTWQTVELTAASDGTVTIELPPDERTIFVLAEAESFLSTACTVVDECEAPLDIRLWPLDSVPVEVVANGQPLRGRSTVHVGLMPAYLFAPTGRASRVPHRGPRFRIPGAPMQRFAVQTDQTGHARIPMPRVRLPETIEITVTAPDGRRRDYGILSRDDLPEPPWRFDPVPARATLTVRVEGADGWPLAGVAVETTSQRTANEDQSHEARLRGATWLAERFIELGLAGYGRTDANGEVEIEMMAAAIVAVQATYNGMEAKTSCTLAPSDTKAMTLRIEPTTQLPSITGRLVPRSGRLPNGRWRARVVARLLETVPADTHESRVIYASIRSDGRFAFRNALPGRRYSIEVPWSRAQRETVIAQAGEAGLLITVPPVRSFQVEVVDARSGARVDAEVRVRCGEQNNTLIASFRNDGLVFVKNLSADVREIEVRAKGYQIVKQAFDGATSRVTVRLERNR